MCHVAIRGSAWHYIWVISVLRKGGAKDRDVDVSRPPVVHPIALQKSAALGGAEEVIPVLIGQCVPAAADIRVNWGEVNILLVPIAPAPHWPVRFQPAGLPILIQHRAMQDKPLARRVTDLSVTLGQVIGQRRDVIMAKGWPRKFRRRSLHRQQRLSLAALRQQLQPARAHPADHSGMAQCCLGGHQPKLERIPGAQLGKAVKVGV
jgi:hypothetical protein